MNGMKSVAQRMRGCSFACIGLMVWLLLPQAGFASDPAALQTASQVLDAGEYHSCAVRDDASLTCWGSYGTLESTPPSTGRFLAVSAGFDHTCALRSNGLVVCWGQAASIATPPPVGPFVAITAGRGENCALRPDGRLACWGGIMAGVAPTDAGYLAVSVAQNRGCAIRGDGTLQCWQPGGIPSLGAVPAGRYLSIATGANHACALRSDGEALCWGSNAQGQTAAPTGVRFTALTVGHQYSCGLREDGAIACWGLNTTSQLAAPAGRYTALSAGRAHTCARTVDGNTRCWGGTNGRSELLVPYYQFVSLAAGGGEACALDFNGSVTCAGDTATALRPAVSRYKALSFGDSTACAIGRDDRVSCWGASLGAPPTDRMTAVSVGVAHACALRGDGTVACWGDNAGGQATPPSGRFYFISSGNGFSCGIRDNSSLACWGQGAAVAQVPAGAFYGRLSARGGNVCALDFGNGIHCWGADAAALTPPQGLSYLHEIAVGDRHACVIHGNGVVSCWGNNQNGQLAAPTGDAFSAIVAAGDASCAVKDGMVCWGTTVADIPAPTYPIGSGNLDAGTAHTCQSRANGGLGCWGDNSFGQRAVASGYQRGLDADGDHACAIGGNGTLSCWGDDIHAGATPPGNPVRQVEIGQFNGCAVRGTGEAACWGWNVNGQSTPPAGLFRSVSTGLNHSCGLREDSTLACWGYNADGQATAPAGQFRAVAVGERHSCAIAIDGGLQCWGLGSEGQITPPDIPGATYRALAVGAFHNCALLSHGAVACWGRNDRSQATPPEEGTFVAVAAGSAHSCAVREDTARICWGSSDQGQAPVPTIGPQTLPTIPAGGVNYAADFQMQAPGYTPVAPKFRFIAGSVPYGITLDENGHYAGQVYDPPGTYSFTIEAKDENGFYAVRDMQVVVADATPPTVEPLFNGEFTQAGWYNIDVQLEWRVRDAQSPVTGSTGCGTITISQDTDGTDYTCTATSGGGTTSRTVTIRRDTIGPDTRFDQIPSLPQWGAGPYSASFAFSMAGTDPSGVAGFECNINGPLIIAMFLPCNSPKLYSFLELNYDYVLQVRAKDVAGNVDPTPVVHTWRVSVDPSPPTIDVLVDGTLGNNGWYRSDVQLDWSIVDPQTPVTFTNGCVDLLIDTDTSGRSEFCNARSGGGDGWRYISIKRDATPPTIIASPGGTPNAAGWYRANVIVAYACSDATSGVAGCPGSDLVVQEGGNVPSPARSVSDVAGNVTAVNPLSINLDKTSPSVVATATPAANAAGWHRSDVGVQFVCSDALSGLAGPCPSARTISQEGRNIPLNDSVGDLAGNFGGASLSISLDKTAPTVSALASSAPNANGWYRNDVMVNFSCNDTLSGLAGSCPPSQFLSQEGAAVASIAQTVTDVAGNTSASSNVVTVKLDRTAPLLSVNMPPANIVLNASHDFALNATDALSGIASQSCGAIHTGTLGTRTVTCTAVDRAGNTVSRSATYRVVYDFVPLSAPLSNPGQLYLVEAPRSVPFEWRVRDANGVAITNATLTQTIVTQVTCPNTGIPLPTRPAGETDTFENFGDGRYRRNWWINPTNPISCLRLDVVLNDGTTHSATIRIVPKIRRTGGPGQPQVATPAARSAPSSRPAATPRSTSQPARQPIKTRRDVQRAVKSGGK